MKGIGGVVSWHKAMFVIDGNYFRHWLEPILQPA